MLKTIANLSTWLSVRSPRRRAVRGGLRIEGIETLEERRVLSARSVLSLPAEVRLGVPREDLESLAGRFLIAFNSENPPEALANLIAMDVVAKNKKVRVNFYDNDDLSGKPALSMRGKGEDDQIPVTGFKVAGKGKQKDKSFFMDAPEIDQGSGATIIHGSFRINNDFTSITAADFIP